MVHFHPGQASRKTPSALNARAVSRIRRGPIRIIDWMLQGFLRVAVVARIFVYQAMSCGSLQPFSGNVMG